MGARRQADSFRRCAVRESLEDFPDFPARWRTPGIIVGEPRRVRPCLVARRQADRFWKAGCPRSSSNQYSRSADTPVFPAARLPGNFQPTLVSRRAISGGANGGLPKGDAFGFKATKGARLVGG